MALKPINTLIKLHKRRVDILRRELTVLEEERRQVEEAALQLRAELKAESELAVADPKMAGFFGPYSQRVAEILEKFAREAARLTLAIAGQVERIRDEFSEQKKFETAREQELKRIQAKAQALQQQRFDEIGAQQYLRSHPE